MCIPSRARFWGSGEHGKPAAREGGCGSRMEGKDALSETNLRDPEQGQAGVRFSTAEVAGQRPGAGPLPLPATFTLVAGASEGPSRLNAFDNALLEAGIGDLNLVKISSVLPAGAFEVPEVNAPPGALVPTAYGAVESQVPGEVIAAAVAIALPADGGSGVIFEFSGRTTAQDAEAAVRRMAEAAFERRGRPLREVRSRSVEHTVQVMGCAIAAVALGFDAP